jgi:phage-related baseplate assembly protein
MMGQAIVSLPAPVFVNDADGTNPNLVLADMITAFEAAAERTLQPAQVERLLIDLYAYRESLVRNAVQYAGQQNLLAFAAFPMIDYLGGLVGVTRLQAQPATTTIQFTLANALTVAYTVIAKTQVGSSDGQFVFATNSDVTIAAGSTTATVNATATVAGSGGNGYLAGQINVLLNPSALISGATNTSTSSGGSAPETDDHLRTRIQAAPNQFSSAGPAGAYRFFALGVDPSIVDVQVVSPAPGTVNVYVLTGPITAQPASAPNAAGIAGQALLSEVQAAMNADTVRPLTDTLVTSAVSEIDYQISAIVTLYSDADPNLTMSAAATAVQELAIALASQIQRDLVPSQIVAALSVPGVYEVTLSSPAYTQLTAGQWANCTSISLAQAVSNEHS